MNKFPNQKGLRRVNELTKEQRQELARKAGLKSGEVRRKNKQLKDELLYLLDVTDDKGSTIREKLCFSLVQQGITGNIRAFEIIRSTIGENPIEQVEKTITQNIDEKLVDLVINKIKDL